MFWARHRKNIPGEPVVAQTSGRRVLRPMGVAVLGMVALLLLAILTWRVLRTPGITPVPGIDLTPKHPMLYRNQIPRDSGGGLYLRALEALEALDAQAAAILERAGEKLDAQPWPRPGTPVPPQIPPDLRWFDKPSAFICNDKWRRVCAMPWSRPEIDAIHRAIKALAPAVDLVRRAVAAPDPRLFTRRTQTDDDSGNISVFSRTMVLARSLAVEARFLAAEGRLDAAAATIGLGIRSAIITGRGTGLLWRLADIACLGCFSMLSGRLPSSMTRPRSNSDGKSES